ncbi:TetR/AcrR family transcriptional regulator [Limobrevibacterium gyesilva]|uniref:TetR/AcrR family transcriptional regulator n=1 Tax=Limobrevibacterium gyesilva TaxID=2991712 RepID=A0AA42CDZ2_9PROT|nr:TetR/AcrR family transcriptional regulator [Limobrevibacterium gyesilva]
MTLPDADTEISPKRRQVLEAAADLFMANGYGSVSMEAVARAANVSKATLYAYFESKDQLFATIVGEACRRNTVNDENFPAEVEDIRAELHKIGVRVLGFLLQERTLAIFRVAVAESGRFPELGRAFITNGPQAFRDRFAAWVAAQAAAGHLVAADTHVAAEQFMALLRAGLFLRATLALPPAPTGADIDATVAAAVETFLRAFGPPK